MTASAQFLDGDRRDGSCRARPEERGEVLRVPGWCVDRFLQVQPGVDVAKEELRDPLVMLVTAWGPPGGLRFAVAQRHCGRKGGARSWTAGDRAGFHPKNLASGLIRGHA